MKPLFAVSIYVHLPIFLIVFSLVYSATRHDRWDRIFAEALSWGVRVGGFLLMVGLGLFIASTYPDQWPYLLAGAGVVAVLWYGWPYYRKYLVKKKPEPPAGK